jgi:hypothetical protein
MNIIKTLAQVASKNVTGYYCRDCSSYMAKMYFFNKKFNKLKFDGFYIKCKMCSKTTPIVESIGEAESHFF